METRMKHYKTNILLLGIDAQSAEILLKSQAQKFGVEITENSHLLSIKAQESIRFHKFLKEVSALFGNKALFGQNLPQIALKLLQTKKLKLTTAESCTGGLLAYQFTQLSGASEIYDGGVISYANNIKEAWLNVDSQNLSKFGAVSEMVVGEMSKGALELSGADIALAASGIAGPHGGSTQKPVGTTFISVQQRGQKPKIARYLFKGSRKSCQKQTCQSAIMMLIREIIE